MDQESVIYFGMPWVMRDTLSICSIDRLKGETSLGHQQVVNIICHRSFNTFGPMAWEYEAQGGGHE